MQPNLNILRRTNYPPELLRTFEHNTNIATKDLGNNLEVAKVEIKRNPITRVFIEQADEYANFKKPHF